MLTPPDFEISEQDGYSILVCSGDWRGRAVQALGARLSSALSSQTAIKLNLAGVHRMDTAGAYVLYQAISNDFDLETIQGRPEIVRLMQLVTRAAQMQPQAPPRIDVYQALLSNLGRIVSHALSDTFETIRFAGHLLMVTAGAIANPRRIRWAACVSLAERAGLDAIPIILTANFFIGAVIALLGINTLRQFGAEIFVVEMIGIAVLREFGIVITAVLLAGRSASAFAAEIGAMKMNQEIDAMTVLGVDPFEALVLPRFAALLIALPLLTFVASLAGLLGGLLVTWNVLGVVPTFFLNRIVENVGATHFWIALSKAPVMAIAIAGIGCRQGLLVGGDVLSLGRHVTAAVVHAIFAIILIDAVFALIYMQLNL